MYNTTMLARIINAGQAPIRIAPRTKELKFRIQKAKEEMVRARCEVDHIHLVSDHIIPYSWDTCMGFA